MTNPDKELCGYGCGRKWHELGEAETGFDDCVSAYHIPPPVSHTTFKAETERLFREAFTGGEDDTIHNQDDVIIGFVHSRCDALLGEMRKMVEGMIWKVPLEGPQTRELHYNSALSDLLAKLEEIK